MGRVGVASNTWRTEIAKLPRLHIVGSTWPCPRFNGRVHTKTATPHPTPQHAQPTPLPYPTDTYLPGYPAA